MIKNTLRIHYLGSQCILELLEKVIGNKTISEDEFKNCFNKNMFFFNFYAEYFGITEADIRQALCKANSKDDISDNNVINKLHDGFYSAANKINELYLKIDSLKNMNISEIEKEVLLYLPEKTEINFEIHFTIDGFNGGIQHKNGVGYSLLTNAVSSDAFIPTIKHEMHHCGVEFWSLKDTRRQSVLSEQSKTSIAVRFLEDLLREGLAIYFFNRDYYNENDLQYKKTSDEYKQIIHTYSDNINELFILSNTLLNICFDEKEDIISCKKLYNQLTYDENGIHPIGHFIGFKMMETMLRIFTHQEIFTCIKAIENFLPMYNHAAAKTNQFVFDVQILSKINNIFNNRSNA